MNEAETQAYNFKPPTKIDGLTIGQPDYNECLYHQAQSSNISAAASSIDTTADSVTAANPQRLRGGGYWITVQPVGAIAYVRFGSTSTTATTTATGYPIADGVEKHFFISVNERYIDVIASAAGTLRWWRSSARKDGYAPGTKA